MNEKNLIKDGTEVQIYVHHCLHLALQQLAAS